MVVVGETEVVALATKISPSQSEVGVGIEVGEVGHALLVGDVWSRRAESSLHVVAHIHASEVAADAEPVAIAVTHREVEAHGLHLAVVDIRSGKFATTQVGDIALDKVLGVAIDEAPFGIDRVTAEMCIVAEIEVEVVAVFRTDTDVAHLQVFIAKHFVDGRQSVGLFIRQLGLQLREDKECAGCSVAE